MPSPNDKFINKPSLAINAARGFSLIELIIVIVLLGALAAIALPRFFDLQRDARIAQLEGLAGAIESAASLAHAACAVSAECRLDATGPQQSDRRICPKPSCSASEWVLLYNGYPMDSNTGIVRMLTLGGYTVTGSNPINFSPEDAFEFNCRVRYQRAPTPGSGPTVELLTSGC